MSLAARFRAFQHRQLSQIEVASPCPANWDEMVGDEKVRFCSGCQLHVFNLSAMDVEEAAERVAEHADGLCVRFYRRSDGTILTQDCPVGVETRRRKRRVAVIKTSKGLVGAAVAASLAVAIPVNLFAPQRTMGMVMRPVTPEMEMWNAISTNDAQRLQKLLQADAVNGASADRNLLLLWAIEEENAPAVELLLKHGADAGTRDDAGRTALSLAQEAGNQKVMALLRGAGARE